MYCLFPHAIWSTFGGQFSKYLPHSPTFIFSGIYAQEVHVYFPIGPPHSFEYQNKLKRNFGCLLKILCQLFLVFSKSFFWNPAHVTQLEWTSIFLHHRFFHLYIAPSPIISIQSMHSWPSLSLHGKCMAWVLWEKYRPIVVLVPHHLETKLVKNSPLRHQITAKWKEFFQL